MKDELCTVLRRRKQLVTIFKFDSEQYHGNLEDAILEALFNGNRSRLSNSSDDSSVFSCQVLGR